MNKPGSFAKLLARLRTGTCISLFGLTVLGGALAAPPVWAPEDPWRVVAEIPAVRGHQAAASEMLARFLDRAGIRLSPEATLDIAASVAAESQRHGLDPALLISVIMVESRFRTDAISEKGAIGLMQLLPSTALAVAGELKLPWGGDVYLLDARTNIELGTHYLSRLLRIYDGDLSLALTAYNKGPGYVQNMLASGVMESTPSGALSSYVEKIRLAQLENRPVRGVSSL
ncbi:MAG: lytic transglycosylase domain-containing protein [Candidatus Polarisedimenticolia bacterium]